MGPKAQGMVLVVDDDPDVRTAIERAARGHATMRFAATGKAALEALAAPNGSAGPALILLDYGLPDLDGLQVLAHIRAHPRTRSVPVVMFSSMLDPERVRAALAQGANSWVAKADAPDRFDADVRAICSYWLGLHAQV